MDAEKTALRLIARAEQNSVSLERKLKKRGHDTPAISEVISKLTELNLLNDSRYACLWLQSRFRFARSPRRLLSSLCARGIEHDEAEAALKKTLDIETELVLLKRFSKKYAGKMKGNPDDNRSIKFLLKSEGFSTAAIMQFLGID